MVRVAKREPGDEHGGHLLAELGDVVGVNGQRGRPWSSMRPTKAAADGDEEGDQARDDDRLAEAEVFDEESEEDAAGGAAGLGREKAARSTAWLMRGPPVRGRHP